MATLLHHMRAMAANNAWANHRLLKAAEGLAPVEFVKHRTSFFPTLKATFNHNLTVDCYYLDAMERAVSGRPVNLEAHRFFEPLEPCGTIELLAQAQRLADKRLIALCDALTEDQLELDVGIKRRAGVLQEPMFRLLAHLFQHQIHHRGQIHAMLSGTPVAPPQLDEFFCANEAHLRAEELAELGLSEDRIWGART